MRVQIAKFLSDTAAVLIELFQNIMANAVFNSLNT